MSAGYAIAQGDTEWQTEDAKKAFAKGILFNPKDTYKVAKEIFGGDPGKSLHASTFWVNDPVVLEEQKALIEQHGELYFLPNKAHIARKLYEEGTTAKTSSERQAALKAYSQIMGFIEEGRTTNLNQTNIALGGGDNKVMVVTSHGTDEQWEKKAVSQQAGLVESAQADIARDEAELEAAQGEDGTWDVPEVKRA